KYLHLVIGLHHGEVAEIGNVYIDDTLSTDPVFDKPIPYVQGTEFTLLGAYDPGVVVSVSINGDPPVLATGGGSLEGTAAQVAENIFATYPAVYDAVSVGSTVSITHLQPNVAFAVVVEITSPTVTATPPVNSLIPLDVGTLVRVNKHLGAADQTADADLVAEAEGQWTADHRLRGIAYLYARLEFDYRENINAFPSGVTNVSALVKGRNVYDPRTETTAWADNFALCVLDYLIGTVSIEGGTEPIGVGATLDEIDVESFIAAANICDEEIEIAAGGTERRYTCNGSYTMDGNPATIVDQLLPCAAAQLVYSAGKYRLFVGAYTTPDLTITADWLRGPVQLQPYGNRKDLHNAVRGVYVAPDLNYELADFAPQASAPYAAEDGEVIYRDIRLSYVQSSATAQRIARLILERSRRAATLLLPCNYVAMACALWQTVTLDIAQLPAYQGTVWRITGWALSDAGGVDLTLQREEAAAYAWSAAQEKGAQDYLVPGAANPRNIPVPADLEVVSDPLTATDGAEIPRLRITWTPPDDGRISGYELQYKRSDALFYQSGFPLGMVSVSWVAYLDSGIDYDVRLRAISIYGTHSDWVEVTGVAAGVAGFALLLDGGAAGSVYQVDQSVDGGAANTVYSGSQVMDGGPA
ncbi:MAG TPA: hypothetical protein VF104_07470, partial [Burkholderiales bacterium]